MKVITNFLEGKKTYIVCAATIIIAVCQFYLKDINGTYAISEILAALAAAGIRNGITTQIDAINSLIAIKGPETK
jgi:hypothetical protein